MRISTLTRMIVLTSTAATLALAASAIGDGGQTQRGSHITGQAQHQGKVVLRRDGSKAEPFVPNAGAPASSTEPNGFDWGDAAIGAGSAFFVVLLASGVLVLTRRRRRAGAQPTVPA
jgi:hypothetical protein